MSSKHLIENDMRYPNGRWKQEAIDLSDEAEASAREMLERYKGLMSVDTIVYIISISARTVGLEVTTSWDLEEKEDE